MVKLIKLSLTISILLISSGCEWLHKDLFKDRAKQISKKDFSKSSKVELDKTLIKTFKLKWNIENNSLTELPSKIKKSAKNKCPNKKLIMVKIDTNENLQAEGTFKCID